MKPETEVLVVENVIDNTMYVSKGTFKGYAPCPKLDNALNPQIELNSGKVVWGCETLWDLPDNIKKTFKQYEIQEFSEKSES